jgi:hypothetical protein
VPILRIIFEAGQNKEAVPCLLQSLHQFRGDDRRIFRPMQRVLRSLAYIRASDDLKECARALETEAADASAENFAYCDVFTFFSSQQHTTMR